MDIVPYQLDVEKAADLLLALSNPKRLAILTLLIRGEEMAVGKLAEAVDLSQSALSQHLAKLRVAKLVTTRRDAQTIYYSSQSAAVLRVIEVLEVIYIAKGPDEARTF